jgi:DNA-binding XRE family transcriptional regulator
MRAAQIKKEKFFELEKLRKKYGLTQGNMAKLLGVCLSSYNHKVNRITPFDFDEQMIIYQELNKRAKKNGDAPITLDQIFLG